MTEEALSAVPVMLECGKLPSEIARELGLPGWKVYGYIKQNKIKYRKHSRPELNEHRLISMAEHKTIDHNTEPIGETASIVDFITEPELSCLVQDIADKQRRTFQQQVFAIIEAYLMAGGGKYFKPRE